MTSFDKFLMDREMKRAGDRILMAIATFLTVGGLYAENGEKPVLNPALPPQQRAEDLVRRMTVEEKVTQLVNQSRAIPRLTVPDYDWWSEASHGVATKGTTEFPNPVGLAATFDTDSIYRMAVVIGTEGRIKHVQGMRDGHSDIFEGLDFWAPNINIFRDPRWGRGQETFGEDPFLTARMGVAFVTGMQGDDPKYYRVISTPKHFAVHSGPEPSRHKDDVKVSKHDQLDTYLPAFRATVTEGRLVVEVVVTNTGKRDGDEVAQVYLSFPNVAGAPLRALRAFKRIHLKKGEAQKLRFEVKERNLSMVSEAGEPMIAEGQYSVSVGGGQPDTGAPTVMGRFQVRGTKALPE